MSQTAFKLCSYEGWTENKVEASHDISWYLMISHNISQPGLYEKIMSLKGGPQQLEILGPLCGSARLGDVHLEAKMPSTVRLYNIKCGNVCLATRP